ncbi:hypothetical protein [Catenulispora subtropica]|uniref:Globin n=1 Tax=Catenulispora subtropica TaxID=450798 RepID=A0ABP5DQ64_9ACTN
MTQPTTAGVGRPSAECIRNVQLSCQLLQRHEGVFVDSFFHKVLDEVRWAGRMGPERARPLCDGLARSVLWAGLSQDSDELIERTMREVGANYKRQGVPDEWYRELGKSLLFAVRQMHPSDWGSLLSSDWVAYYMWLSEFIRLGALDAPAEDTSSEGAGAATGTGGTPGAGGTPGTGGTGSAASSAVVRIESLGDVVSLLRSRYFPDNERALTTICTRVALRTGTDLRNPRPDQYADPVAISNVLSTLLVLGYSLQSFSIEDASEPEPADAEGQDTPAASAGSGSIIGRSRALRRRVSRIFGVSRSTPGGER